MNQWLNDLIKILKGMGIILIVFFAIFIINQFITLYQFLANLHPILAVLVVGFLLGGSLYFIVKNYQLWFRGNKHVILKDNPTEEEYEDYLETMIEILLQNPHITNKDLSKDNITSEQIVKNSFAKLDQLSDPIIKENANALFLSTAISQNGVLDSLMVFFTLIRMIWQLSNIYRTRPSLSSLLKLYLQVGGVVLMARTIEDIDLIEDQLEPIIATVLGESIASAIPGMVPITNLIVSSLMEGSINAFLALRVGMITQAYLGMEVPQSQKNIRYRASRQSLKLMGSIITDNSKTVVKSVAKAVKNAGVGTARKWFRIGT